MSTTHTNNSQNQIVSTPPPSQPKKTHLGEDNDFDYYQIRSEKSESVSLKKIDNENNIVVECHDQTAKCSLGKPSSLTQKQGSTMAAVEGGRERKKLDDESMVAAEESGRERLKRHRVEMAGRVWIPDTWGQEDLLKDWIDCTAFDASLVNNTIMSARAALMQKRPTPANSTTATGVLRRRIENSGHSSTVWALSFNAIGDKMVTSSDDLTIKVWGADIMKMQSGDGNAPW